MNFENRLLEVEESLWKSALGGLVEELQAVKVKESVILADGSKGTKEEVVVVPVQKYYPPSLAAIKFLLVNREPNDWKDNPHKVSVDNENLKLKKQKLDKEIF